MDLDQQVRLELIKKWRTFKHPTNFTKLDLAKHHVDLVCISDINPIETSQSIQQCLHYSTFGAVDLFTSLDRSAFVGLPDYVNIIKIKPIQSRSVYSSFCLTELHDHISADWILLCQYDGFIINPNNWTNSFFDYDYIGAPVWQKGRWEPLRVGNGGFSLRSKRLFNILKEHKRVFCKYTDDLNFEDLTICVRELDLLKENGIKIPDVSVGWNFSCEFLAGYLTDPNIAFGIHSPLYYRQFKLSEKTLHA